MIKIKPLDYVPLDSQLTFLRQTVIGWRKRATGERILSKGIYLCSCGVEVEKNISEVKRGKVKSCGICDWGTNQIKKATTKHGIWNTPLYNIWVDIKNRCYKPRHKAYLDYGGRGVTMCEEWYNNPKSFYDWAINNGWEQGLEIDKDIKGGMIYSPETCSIVTHKINTNYTRSNRYIYV